MLAADANKRLVYALAAVLLGLAAYRLLFPLLPPSAVENDPPAVTSETVTLVVQQPDSPPRTIEIAFSAGQTVADATRGADLQAIWRGSGEMAFLESLAGVPNQGGDGLNWQFEVNEQYAERGAGSVVLEPGDRVLWKLAPYE